MRRALALACALVMTLLTREAAAGSRSYEAARALVGGAPNALFGMNVAALRTSALARLLFPRSVPTPAAGSRAAGLTTGATTLRLFSKMRAVCGVDPAASIADVTMAGTAASAITFVALEGNVRADAFASCAAQAFAGKTAAPMQIVVDGRITRYAILGKAPYYVAATGRNVVAIASDPTDEAILKKWITGGRLPPTWVGGAAAKVDTGAPLWGVFRKTWPWAPEGTLTSVYGSGTSSSGDLTFDVHFVADSAAGATGIARDANRLLSGVLHPSEGNAISPQMRSFLSGLTIRSSASEVVVKLDVSDAILHEVVGSLGVTP